LDIENIINQDGNYDRLYRMCNAYVQWLQIDHIIPQQTRSHGVDDITKIVRQIMKGECSSSEFQLCANCNFAKRDLKSCLIVHSLDSKLFFYFLN